MTTYMILTSFQDNLTLLLTFEVAVLSPVGAAGNCAKEIGRSERTAPAVRKCFMLMVEGWLRM
jgi:hypothetical protein